MSSAGRQETGWEEDDKPRERRRDRKGVTTGSACSVCLCLSTLISSCQHDFLTCMFVPRLGVCRL